jgi:hypothetical protein
MIRPRFAAAALAMAILCSSYPLLADPTNVPEQATGQSYVKKDSAKATYEASSSSIGGTQPQRKGRVVTHDPAIHNLLGKIQRDFPAAEVHRLLLELDWDRQWSQLEAQLR